MSDEENLNLDEIPEDPAPAGPAADAPDAMPEMDGGIGDGGPGDFPSGKHVHIQGR